MVRPKRWALLASGGLAGVLVVATCWSLIDSTQLRPTPPATMASMPLLEQAPADMPRSEFSPTYHAAEARSDDSTSGTAAIPVTVPQIAYSFTLGYRLPASAIAGAQQAHLDLCNRLGPRCQLVGMQRATGDDGTIRAFLKLRVASPLGQQLAGDLTQAVGKAGGRAVDTQISAEDVSKDLVDTDARIRQREILVARLTDMLRGRAGKVGELVEAERSVAQAQEELDQARGWLGELRGRVAYSNFSISYMPTTAPVAAPSPQGFLGQIGDAVAQSGAALAGFARGLLVFLIFLGPWVLLLGLGLFAVRPLLRRWRRAGLEPVNEDA
jgi:hypothetical protein